MTQERRSRIRQAFLAPSYVPVKVTAAGFVIQGQEFEELLGRISKMELRRKLFQNQKLACMSEEGERAVDGTVCAQCQHPLCQARLHIQLVAGGQIYLVELPSTSARNLFKLEDQALAEGCELVDWWVRLSVVDHDTWGEVLFTKASPPDLLA